MLCMLPMDGLLLLHRNRKPIIFHINKHPTTKLSIVHNNNSKKSQYPSEPARSKLRSSRSFHLNPTRTTLTSSLGAVLQAGLEVLEADCAYNTAGTSICSENRDEACASISWSFLLNVSTLTLSLWNSATMLTGHSFLATVQVAIFPQKTFLLPILIKFRGSKEKNSILFMNIFIRAADRIQRNRKNGDINRSFIAIVTH